MRIKPEWQKKTASERVKILFALAEKSARDKPQMTKRYVELARKIAMRYNVRIPKEYKRRICKNCRMPLIPGFNCTIRSRSKKTVITCKCGNIMRFPYK
ncbi:MAG: ribonuclease P protein component 4 [Candidatus Aenigmatarchaeota archaeon]